MACPLERSITVDAPLLIIITIVARPYLQLLAVGVVSVWNVETFIAIDFDLGDRSFVGGTFLCTTFNDDPLTLCAVECTAIRDGHWGAVVVSGCLKARRKAS